MGLTGLLPRNTSPKEPWPSSSSATPSSCDLWEVVQADMENARNFTRAGFIIFKFYPNVREIHQIHNCEKLRTFNTRVSLSSWERLPSWVGLPRLGNLTHHRMILPLATIYAIRDKKMRVCSGKKNTEA